MKYKTWLKKAVNQNMLIFDVDAPQGVLTPRLLTLAKNVTRTNYACKADIKYMFIDEQVTKDIETLYSLQRKDKHGVLFVFEDGNVLLGSY